MKLSDKPAACCIALTAWLSRAQQCTLLLSWSTTECEVLGMAPHFMPKSCASCACSPKDDIAAYMKDNEELA